MHDLLSILEHVPFLTVCYITTCYCVEDVCGHVNNFAFNDEFKETEHTQLD